MRGLCVALQTSECAQNDWFKSKQAGLDDFEAGNGIARTVLQRLNMWLLRKKKTRRTKSMRRVKRLISGS
jgi:hypothetical protein